MANDMRRLTVPTVLSSARAASYRASGWWDSRRVEDGIEAAALARPDDLAIADDNGSLSWAQLASRVTVAVARMDTVGLAVGDVVVLVIGNTVDGIIAFHACVRAGITAVLLDRRCGRADLDTARSLVTGQVWAIVPAEEFDRLCSDDQRAVRLDDLTAAGALGSASSDEPDRDAAAVVLLTSGTTGRPKAVVHSLNTLGVGVDNMATITGCTDGDVLFLVSPLASITGVMKMCLAADRHAPLVITGAFDPASTLDRITEVGATLMGGAPVIAERILGAAQARGVDTLPLRVLPLGGAMLPRPLLELARDEFGIEAARVYGSSEAPNFSGSLPTDSRERALSDDGALMPGGEVRIGSAEHPEEGMLRGPGLFLGYVDPADNAAAFEGDWFRTGDLLEEQDGRLTVTGRLKEIVNRNGLKFSPAEVDVALAGLAGVDEFSCYGCPDPETGERLALAVRPLEGALVTLDAVVAHLLARGIARRKLPEQLVLWTDPLPRTPSGKVVRSQLVRDAPDKPSEFVARLR